MLVIDPFRCQIPLCTGQPLSCIHCPERVVELNLKVAKSVLFATFRELLIKNVRYEKKMSPPWKGHVQLFPNLNHFI